jgi:FkbM family methyltransferase
MTPVKQAVGGWLTARRAELAHRRHPDEGEISARFFYARRLGFRDLAFDIGANHGEHTEQMLARGARVLAVEPQAKLADELRGRFPGAVVLRTAVSDQPGEAVLHLAQDDDRLASLDETFAGSCEVVPVVWEDSENVPVMTLDQLIEQYGEPRLVKIDTEGFDHRVLAGLGRAIEHVLFEVHAALADRAASALERLEALGRYEYFVMPFASWMTAGPLRPDRILEDLPTLGNVYARRL